MPYQLGAVERGIQSESSVREILTVIGKIGIDLLLLMQGSRWPYFSKVCF
jgi:hypothetical protein